MDSYLSDELKSLLQLMLECEFGIPVYDKYPEVSGSPPFHLDQIVVKALDAINDLCCKLIHKDYLTQVLCACVNVYVLIVSICAGIA